MNEQDPFPRQLPESWHCEGVHEYEVPTQLPAPSQWSLKVQALPSSQAVPAVVMPVHSQTCSMSHTANVHGGQLATPAQVAQLEVERKTNASTAARPILKRNGIDVPPHKRETRGPNAPNMDFKSRA